MCVKGFRPAGLKSNQFFVRFGSGKEKRQSIRRRSWIVCNENLTCHLSAALTQDMSLKL